MYENKKFGTAINCIDGRAQSPVADWLKLNYQLDYVDMITVPGADKILAEGSSAKTERISRRVELSANAHASGVVAIAGHYDCAANPVTFEEHKKQIGLAVQLVESWKLGLRVIGIYVNEWNSVDLITDTGSEEGKLRSFL